MEIIDVFLHLDQYLAIWSQNYGQWIYLIVFLVIFAETGLVFTPFLPGDSLLFALGAMTSLGQGGLDLTLLSALLLTGAFIGDNVNYHFGGWAGPQVFSRPDSRFLNPQNLARTQSFYLKYGAYAVIIARFAPIIRTFVPFVAGVARMPLKKFLGFSFFGAILWTQIFLQAGHHFGNLPIIKRNFHFVILAVIGLSLMPIFLGWIKSRQQKVSG